VDSQRSSYRPSATGDRRRINIDGAALVDESTLGGNPPDEILGGQYRRHPATTLRRSLDPVLNLCRRRPCTFRGVILEIDIGRAAYLMLRWCGDMAEVESARRVDELAENADDAGVAVWVRIIDAIRQLVNTTPPGPVH
jgi:hypothetical protein